MSIYYISMYQKSKITLICFRFYAYFLIILPTNEVCLSVCSSVCLSRVNLTLAITFQPKEIRLSYYTCGFLVTKPFWPYQQFWSRDLNLAFNLLLKKNLTLAITFEPRQIEYSYYAFVFLVAGPFCEYQHFEPPPPDLDFNFWPYFEKLKKAL